MAVIVKDESGRISRRNIEAVRFVPLRTGTT
jgi:protein-L-isoaspartate O-methyltransferase